MKLAGPTKVRRILYLKRSGGIGGSYIYFPDQRNKDLRDPGAEKCRRVLPRRRFARSAERDPNRRGLNFSEAVES